MFAALYSGGEAIEILDPSGFEVHFASPDDSGEEHVLPAGTVVHPPRGRFFFWLEDEWRISPRPQLSTFAEVQARRPPSLMEVGPGGRIALAPSWLDQGGGLWVLAASSSENRSLPYEFTRRSRGAALATGILMPAGTIVAGLRESSEGPWIALARPFRVPAGREVVAPLERPHENKAFLFTYFEKPATAALGADLHRSPGLVVAQAGRETPADFATSTAWGTYAIWFDLAPGAAVLRGGNHDVYLQDRALELRPGGIAEAKGELLERPLLDVSLLLPQRLREGDLTLRVEQVDDEAVLAEVELEPTAGHHRFESLVQAPVEVELDTVLGTFRRQVDLTGKTEESVLLDPELIELSGTVYLGGEPQRARLVFEAMDGEKIEVEADDEGEYSAVALRPVRGLAVRIPNGSREPWLDFFAPVLQKSQILDVEIPDAEVVVKVVDAITGEGLAGAGVGVRNVFFTTVDETLVGERDGRTSEKVVGQSHVTGEDGTVRLPPPREGRIEIYASAEGYRSLSEPLRVEIQDASQDRNLEIRLTPVGPRVAVRLLLPDGSPASGAEVLRLAELSGSDSSFSGRAAADGTVEIPESPESGFLLLKHPQGAIGIEAWPEWLLRDRREWSFPRRAPRPLRVRALTPSGEEAAAGAEIALLVRGHRLSGMTMRWLLAAPDRTDRHGVWTAEGLPPEPLRVLAWSPAAWEQLSTGALDTLSTPVSYPWPPVVEVQSVR